MSNRECENIHTVNDDRGHTILIIGFRPNTATIAAENTAGKET